MQKYDGCSLLRRHSEPVFWCVFALLILPWAWVQAQQATHSDLLWLVEGFNRIMEGYRGPEFVYETNPPLNIFTYALPALLGKWTGFPVHYLLFLYTSILILISAASIHAILKHWPFLQRQDIMIAIAFMILTNTILIGTQFGERDQYIGLALVPFTLMQLAITYGLPYPKKLKWPLFLIGTVFILLKPHHGLIPTILLVHRMFVQRRWTVFKDADFIALSIMTSLYIVVTWVFFQDFIKVILPDVLELYLEMKNMKSTTTLSFLAAYTILVIGFFPFILQINPRHRLLIVFFLACGLVSIIPFYVQGMSFRYHLFPAFTFTACGAGMTLLGLSRNILKGPAALFFSLCVFSAFCYYIKPVNHAFPKHADYAHLPLTTALAPCAGKPECTFFIFHTNMGIVHETAYYSGIRHASRFAALWFLPTLLEKERLESPPREETLRLREKFSAMMAEDLRRYKPELLFIAKDIEIKENSFHFVEYFTAHQPFAAEWKNYRKSGDLVLRHSDYFTGSEYDDGTEVKYDVYQRIDTR